MIEICLIAIVLLLLVNLYFSYKAQAGFQNRPLLDSFKTSNKELENTIRDEFTRNRNEFTRNSKESREELTKSFNTFGESISVGMARIAEMQKSQLDTFSKNLISLTQTNEEKLRELNNTLGTKIDDFQQRMESSAKVNRDELTNSLKSFQEQFKSSVEEFNALQNKKFDSLINKQGDLLQSTEQRLDKMRDDNNEKLERMRRTVDEKLHDTLEKRLGQSFQIVSDRLEKVQKGLGEMQTLANGVGDLKRVLVNVKARGTWAEVQLGAILEQILIPKQYAKNVHTKIDSREMVEYAIKLPGAKNEPDSCVWLPIDSKFPQEDYLRIQEAAEKGDAEAVQTATTAFNRTIRLSAKSIQDKYLHPTETTDLAIMFLATEGMYAEVYRQVSLVEELQQKYRVVVAGPSTLAAILSSLRMGFSTLDVEQRASEIWKVLAAVKTEFSNFGKVLSRVKTQLQTVSNTIEKTEVRTRAMDRKLREVEQLPANDAAEILELPVTEIDVSEE